ncbi:hypothetical protein E2C01_064931 [Portunus trituberculatus]|uniref:Uncharacterized protein n=1 Tax=Portunus trituberculatus TaxID=210409 RepID=A0A5B7HL64_PORTR|nr:hypothetical protein [Portunus trituberculatus]
MAYFCCDKRQDGRPSSQPVTEGAASYLRPPPSLIDFEIISVTNVKLPTVITPLACSCDVIKWAGLATWLCSPPCLANI